MSAEDFGFEWDDENSSPDEDRWKSIGKSRFGVLIVVYTDKVHKLITIFV